MIIVYSDPNNRSVSVNEVDSDGDTECSLSITELEDGAFSLSIFDEYDELLFKSIVIRKKDLSELISEIRSLFDV